MPLVCEGYACLLLILIEDQLLVSGQRRWLSGVPAAHVLHQAVRTGKTVDMEHTALNCSRAVSLQAHHAALSFPCSHIALPPQALHGVLNLSCTQPALPPHSLHVVLNLPCTQLALPPQSLNVVLNLPCTHIALLPQCLHVVFNLPCAQTKHYCSLSMQSCTCRAHNKIFRTLSTTPCASRADTA